MMSSIQVGELARAGMEIGGHTVRHPILACEDLATVEREITEGRARLRELSQTEVDTFAYPNGVPDKDYRSEHVDLLRRLRFRCAVTTSRGIARARLDPHQLPRFTPGDREPWRWSLRLLAARRSVVQVARQPALASAGAAPATNSNH
jgi:peptidoglycan/xylan/chitin deacetylase (PgdA/CDA1 family)